MNVLSAALLVPLMLAGSARDEDLNRYLDAIRTLAVPEMEGRGVGTAGLDRARDWLVDQLEPLDLSPGFGSSHVQPFEVRLDAVATRAELAAGDRPAQPDTDFTVLGFSGEGAFEGEAVFVGYGVINRHRAYDSFAGLGPDGLRGRVALAFRYVPMDEQGQSLWAHGSSWSDAASLPRKAKWAAERGAVALVVVNPPALDQTAQLRPTSITAFEPPAAIPVMHVASAWLAQAMARQTDIRDPAAFFRQMQARANHGQDRPTPLTGLKLRGQARVDRPAATLHNIAAALPGEGDLADQWIVVGAHYDHVGFGESDRGKDSPQLHPGADDNASGVAAVLLLARRLLLDPPKPPRRSVMLIFFSGEERGLLGARHFTRHLDDAGLAADRIVAMINLDMVGRLRDNRLQLFGVDTGEGFKTLVRESAKLHKLQLTIAGSGLGMSDHTPFYFRRIPVLHLFTGNHEDYHRPTDTADRIVPESLRVVDFTESLVRTLATRAQPPRFVAAHGEDEAAYGFRDHGAGPQPLLGILPDDDALDGEPGCGIRGVQPGSPAERAGLQPGDRITAWNGQPVAHPRDLTARVAQSAPGQEVALTVQRGHQTRTVTLTLGRR